MNILKNFFIEFVHSEYSSKTYLLINKTISVDKSTKNKLKQKKRNSIFGKRSFPFIFPNWLSIYFTFFCFRISHSGKIYFVRNFFIFLFLFFMNSFFKKARK
eukprot:Trichotokara_eunicae@DN11126_c0_g1_i1.p1